MLNTMKKSDSIINTTIPGMHGYKPQKIDQLARQKVKEQEEFLWLLKG